MTTTIPYNTTDLLYESRQRITDLESALSEAVDALRDAFDYARQIAPAEEVLRLTAVLLKLQRRIR